MTVAAGSSRSRVGRFTLLAPIGRGGMGEVWLGRAHVNVPGASDLVVIKTLRSGSRTVLDTDAAQRFFDESRLGLLLVHPCVCRVVDAGTDGDRCFIAMELVRGINVKELASRAASAQPTEVHITEIVALWIAACALDGLAYAHDARHPLTAQPLGVVHRDVSPHNVMCADDGSVRVIDFGLALSSLKQAVTEQEVVFGKLAYLAPEQARGGLVDRRADVFSVGVMLYELLARDRFYGDMSTDAIWSVAGTGTHRPRRMHALADDVRAVLVAMLAADPARRLPDAGAARNAVARLLIARGGHNDARAQLAKLVRSLAADELARVRAAEAMVHASASTSSASEAASAVPATESLALLDVRAIEAALAAAQPPTTTLELWAAADPQLDLDPATVRLSDAPPDPSAEFPTSADRSARADPSASAGSGAEHSSADPSATYLVNRSPRAQPPRTASSRTALRSFAFAFVLAFGLAFIVLAFALPPGTSHSSTTSVARAGAPAPEIAPSASSSSNTTPPNLGANTNTNAHTAAAASASTATTDDDIASLAARLEALRGCKNACASILLDGLHSDKLAALPAQQQLAVRRSVDICARRCKR